MFNCPHLSMWTLRLLNKNCINKSINDASTNHKNLGAYVPYPHWILNFFHIERGLIIRIEITILADNREAFYNIFYCEMSFAQYSCIPFPHHVEELRIVLGYLWPNHFMK